MTEETTEQMDGTKSDPITIKKYANRRLYNTATSSYVTLDYLCQMVKDGQDFAVFDAKSGEDITRSVLTQIIFEEESKGQNLLPIRFLRQIIRFYDDNLQALVPRYLEASMESFAKNQAEFQKTIEQTIGQRTGLKQLEEVARQNFTLFDQALKRFLPNLAPDEEEGATSSNGLDHEAVEAATEPDEDDREAEIEALQKQIADMQAKLADLAKRD